MSEKFVIRELGLKPMTRTGVINYFKNSNELTKGSDGKFRFVKNALVHNAKAKTRELKQKVTVYSGYEEYFDKMLQEGYVERAFVGSYPLIEK